MFTGKNVVISIVSALVVLSVTVFSPTAHAEMKQGKVIGKKESKLPEGFVSQGGLTWMPINNDRKDWPDANAYCTHTVIAGKTGWRLPTDDELSALYASGAMKDKGWTLYYTWSSTPGGSGGHYYVDLDNGVVISSVGTYYYYVTCVR